MVFNIILKRISYAPVGIMMPPSSQPALLIVSSVFGMWAWGKKENLYKDWVAIKAQ
jgi:hypothetical protein